MRSVNSAFWLALQQDAVELCELITLVTHEQTYRWTSANAPIVSSGFVYDPLPGASGRGNEEDTSLGIGTIEFSIVSSGSLATRVPGNTLDRAPVTVRRVFTRSADMGTLWVFRGKLAELAFDRQMIGGQARNLFNGVAAKFPYYSYQDTCVWRFGGNGCGFNTTSITFTGSLSASSSTPLVLSATSGTIVQSYSPNGLSKGRVTITSGVNSGQVRTIRAQTGDLFALSHSLPYSVESGGASFSIYPGCRKSLITDCLSKYNNTQRFLGFPWIPKQQYAF